MTDTTTQDMTGDDRTRLLAAVSMVYTDESAAAVLLDRIEFPRELRPIWRVNPRAVWAEVFALLDAGVVAPPAFLRLATAAKADFPYNATFAGLATEPLPAPRTDAHVSSPDDGTEPAPQPSGSSWVFLSYGHADRSYARDLTEDLRARGIPVFIDDRVPTGARWTTTLREQIAGSGAVVVVMTPESAASAWVDRELQEAEELAKPIFPLLLRGDRFMRLNTTQYEDVRDGRLPGERFAAQLRACLDSA